MNKDSHVVTSKINSFPREYLKSRDKIRVRNCTTYHSTIVCSSGVKSIEILKSGGPEYSHLTFNYLSVGDSKIIKQCFEIKLLQENEDFALHDFYAEYLGKHILIEFYALNYCIIQKMHWND